VDFNDTSGQIQEMVFRISKIDDFSRRRNPQKELFKLNKTTFGSEFNAFLVDDPYAIATHYALVWNSEGRFELLDKFAIKKEKLDRSGKTYTLYATIGPYLKGSQTLTEYLQHHPKPSPELLRSFATQLLLALKTLPEGVSHRDLKPDNILVILLNGVPTLKLIDFGLSSVDKTIDSSIRGAPVTMAPELILKESCDLHKTDLFSLYAILHFMMTGRYPIHAETLKVWRPQLKAYGRSTLGPKTRLQNEPYLKQFTETEKQHFLAFLDHLGHPKPEKRWTAQRLLEEDCFLRKLGPPPSKPQGPPLAKTFFQIIVITGALCFIHNMSKRIYKRYFKTPPPPPKRLHKV
jgi:serine/threonine protein kinase